MNTYAISMIKKILPALLGTAVLSGCTANFTEYNTNPNEATRDMTNWDYVRSGSLLLQMEQNVLVVSQPGTGIGTDRYQTVEVMGGDGFAGYFGFAAPSINSAGRYNWDKASWYGDMFTTNYSRTMSAWRELKADFEGKPAFALMQIVKVAAMHRVTDTYGPIPYVQYGQTAQVPYDSQKDVYYKFFEELTNAVDALSGYAAADQKLFEEWDVVYNGSIKAWVKFANSLRLRLAMRLAYVDPSKAEAEAVAATRAPGGLMSEAGDVARLQHISPIASYESPLYVIRGWDDVHMGATIDSYMNGYADPRLSVYFTSASDSKYRGIRAGKSNSSPKAGYTTGLFSTPNVDSKSDVVWMRASETCFLLAEAAWRGWNVGGTAQSFYEQGIRMSFAEHSVSGADAYINNNTAIPANYSDPVTPTYSINARSAVKIKWDAAATEENLERIITQKYIAMFPVGQEAWSEFRRTGYPRVFPVAVNESNGGCVDSDVQIRRLAFPQNEYDTNSDAVARGVTLLGGQDNPGTKLWWDAK